MGRFVVTIESRRRSRELAAFSDHRDAQRALHEALQAVPASRRRTIHGRVTDSQTGDVITYGRAWNGWVGFI
jgi:hypothetical protein